MLGAAAHVSVSANDFVWEPKGGFFHDALFGRFVLFLGKTVAGTTDLFRARVRVTRAGGPVEVTLLRNLTRSPLGDERNLVAAGNHAAYVTAAFGVTQGITLLDIGGDESSRETTSWISRVAYALESWATCGSTQGLARHEVTFRVPPDTARQEFQDDALVLALGSVAQPGSLRLTDGHLETAADDVFGPVVQRVPHGPSLFVTAVWEAFRALRDDPAANVPMVYQSPPTASREVPRLPKRGEWPPSVNGDGQATGTLQPIPGPKAFDGAPPTFYRGSIQPDPAHPETAVEFIAMDTRQVDLRLVPGVREPSSLIGLHGTGRPPADLPSSSIVAAFNGGCAEDGRDAALGFVASRRVFSLPREGYPTIAIRADHSVGLGPWPNTSELPTNTLSILQTPYELVGSGGPNPLPTESSARSALGLLPGGQLVYAWGRKTTAHALARALSLVGSVYALPLRQGGSGSGFVFLQARDNGFDVRPAAPEMSFGSLDKPLSSDVFYVALRTAVPGSSVSWLADAGRQPTPPWLPGIHSAVVVSTGAEVHLLAFEKHRTAFHLRTGAKEPATKAVSTLPSTLDDGEKQALLVAVGLGAGKKRTARGLSINGLTGLPIRADDSGVLVIDEGWPKVLRGADVGPRPGTDYTELPLTADDGKLRPEGREVGSMRSRAAACLLANETFVVATTTFDSDEATTTALLNLGCSRVVALDRGSHHGAFVHRAGTASPPESRYDGTVLYGSDLPLDGRAGFLR